MYIMNIKKSLLSIRGISTIRRVEEKIFSNNVVIDCNEDSEEFCCLLFGYKTRCCTCSMPLYINEEFIKMNQRIKYKDKYFGNKNGRKNNFYRFNDDSENDKWIKSIKTLQLDNKYINENRFKNSLLLKDIKKAYILRVKTSHPDVSNVDPTTTNNNVNEVHSRFIEIQEAYEYLSSLISKS